MKNVDILHIYYGTQGISGLYTEEIYDALKSKFSQEIIVSYYYPFPHGKKIFFKNTDLSSGRKNSMQRMLHRGVEYIFGLLKCMYFIILYQPKIVNYSLNSAFIFDVIFFKIVKIFSSSKLIITCHDVIPLAETEASKAKQMKYRQELFSLADYLLVHNENSTQDLIRIFKINPEKIISHPFPLMDLNKMFVANNNTIKKYDFAMIGHLRKSKGLDLMLDAWEIFQKQHPEKKLLVAGNMPNKADYDLDHYKKLNIVFNLEYLNDREYFDLICNSKTVVLPYIMGSNSGVVYNLIGMNVNIIYSDLPMFVSNPFLEDSGKFSCGNINSLVNAMEKGLHENPKNSNNNLYRENFTKDTINLYRSILKGI